MRSHACTYRGWLAILGLLAVLTTAGAQESIKGTYKVYVNGNVAATDKFEIIPGRQYRDEIQADTAKTTYNLQYENGRLTAYEKQSNGSPTVTIKPNKHMLYFYEGTAMIGMLSDEEGCPVFEPAAYGEYELFVSMLYNEKKGGKQSASVIVPALQDVIPVDIERHGSDVFAVGGNDISASHYRFSIGKRHETVNVWMDGDRMLAAYLATGNKFIIDTRYDQLYDRVKQLINRAM